MTLRHPSGILSWGEETDRNGAIVFDHVGTGAWQIGLSGKGDALEDARDITVEESKETAVEFKEK